MAALRLLVTGSHGLVGREVVSVALARGHNVHTLDRQTGAVHPDAQHHATDLCSDEIDAVVASARPDVVIHLAAQVSVVESLRDPRADHQTNAVGTDRIARAAGRTGVETFVYANSGGAIYDSNSPQPFSEESPTRPQSPYGASKLEGEGRARAAADEFGMHFASLALSNVYGMHPDAAEQPDGVIMRWLRAALTGTQAELRDPTATRDFVHVSDVAHAFLTAAEIMTSVDRVNIGSGRATSLHQLADLISEVTGGRFTYITTSLITGEIAHSTLDISRAQDVLGWRPQTSLQDGIQGMWQLLTASRKEWS